MAGSNVLNLDAATTLTGTEVIYIAQGGADRRTTAQAIANLFPDSGGTVTSVSVTTANGVSGSVDNPTTTPAITLTLGNITPVDVTASGNVTGSNLSGNNTGDQNLFETIAVSGQDNVVALGPGSILTFAAGSGVTITTNAGTGTVTFAAAGVAAMSVLMELETPGGLSAGPYTLDTNWSTTGPTMVTLDGAELMSSYYSMTTTELTLIGVTESNYERIIVRGTPA